MRSLLLFAGITALSLAQAQAPSFEAVSIRPPGMGPIKTDQGFRAYGVSKGGPGTSDPGRWTASSIRVRSLIVLAYRVQGYQVIGPDWIGDVGYDILATVPEGATRPDLAKMILAMLEERFALRVHREIRTFPGYDLLVGKGGLKVRDSISTDPCSHGARPIGRTCPPNAIYSSGLVPTATPDGPGRIYTTPPQSGGGAILAAYNSTLGDMGSTLRGQLQGAMVADKTGDTKHYDIRLEYSPADVGVESTAPSLFTALESELGLKLEKSKVDVECIVIDHVERPSGN